MPWHSSWRTHMWPLTGWESAAKDITKSFSPVALWQSARQLALDQLNDEWRMNEAQDFKLYIDRRKRHSWVEPLAFPSATEEVEDFLPVQDCRRAAHWRCQFPPKPQMCQMPPFFFISQANPSHTPSHIARVGPFLHWFCFHPHPTVSCRTNKMNHDLQGKSATGGLNSKEFHLDIGILFQPQNQQRCLSRFCLAPSCSCHCCCVWSSAHFCPDLHSHICIICILLISKATVVTFVYLCSIPFADMLRKALLAHLFLQVLSLRWL